MPLSTTEKTDAQRTGWWGRTGSYLGGYVGGWLGLSPAIKAVEGSGAFDGKNAYSPPLVYGFAGHTEGLDGKPWPGTFATYRAMLRDPTIALAMAAATLPVLAAEWMIEVDDDLAADEKAGKPADATAEFGKEILERELIDQREGVMPAALRSLGFGFQAFELVWAPKATKAGRDYTGLAKIKSLSPDWTTAIIDEHGNLLGCDNGSAKLRDGQYLWIVYNLIDGNWYGHPLLENCRRSWSNAKTLEDRKMLLVRLGTGIIVKVGYPPDTDENKKLGKYPNRDAALALANALADGQSVAYENLTGIDPQQLIGNTDLAGKSNISIEPIDMGDPGPRLAAIGAEQDRLSKEMVRGILQPERTLIEATMGGSRADSESHGDIPTAFAEATHESIAKQIQEQVANRLILENCGERYVGRIRLKAAPIQDEQKRQLMALATAMLADTQFLAQYIDAIGPDGVQKLTDRLGWGITMNPDDWAALTGDDTDPGAPPTEDGGDADDGVSLSLSASDEEGGHWVTIHGSPVHIAEGQDVGDAIRAHFAGSKDKVTDKHVAHAKQQIADQKAKPEKWAKQDAKKTPEKQPESDKVKRAKAAHVMVDKTIQRYAEEHNEPKFAKAVGGLSFPDSEPVDVVVGDESGVIKHGIELKTMVKNGNNKITMKREAMERKGAWEKKNKATYHTVVLDDSKVFNAKGDGKHDESKRQMFYRRGYGSFRVGGMHPVRNVAELKTLMNTPNSKLPAAAQRKS